MNMPRLGLLLLAFCALVGCETATTPERTSSSTRPSAEAGALAFLAREVPRWPRENKCFSCHNNGDAARALYTAIPLGYSIPSSALADTTAWLKNPEHWENNRGDPSSSDLRLARVQFTAALAVANDAKLIRDPAILERASARLIAEQHSDGSWMIEPVSALGSPATYGTALATFMAMDALARLGSDSAAAACRRAEHWLLRCEVKSVLEAAAVLQAVSRIGDGRALTKRQECLDFIRRSRSAEGGWGPYPDSPPEPFDTAVVLLALTEIRREPGVESMIARGRDFLAQSQLPDGSWPATTRPPRGESYAEQISTTGWATLALLRTTGGARLRRALEFWRSEKSGFDGVSPHQVHGKRTPPKIGRESGP